MNIIIAEHAGFCFGVKRAVETAEKTIKNTAGEKIYSLGPLVHNSQVVDKFKKQGLNVAENLEEISSTGKVIIRSHGIPESLQSEIKNKNLELIDCTCPYVKSVHKKVSDYHKKGYQIVIIGDKSHPEVIGINGWCNNEATIINDEKEAYEIPSYDKICIVSQTTNTLEKFNKLSSIIKEKGKEVKLFNTICNATNLRQTACEELAKKVDAMIVIGGYHSSNTNKLVEVSKKYCKNVYHVEIAKELPLQELSKFNTIGITAGASTPDWIIKEVVDTMEKINNDEILDAIEKSFRTIHRGDIVKGKVIYVTDEEIMVNINYKSDGIISKEELSNDPEINPKDLFKEGDDIEVYVVKLDDGQGNVVLSYKRLEAIRNWDKLEEAFNNKEVVECKVLNDVKGGLSILVHGLKGFIPASQVSIKYVDDLSEYKGKKLNARIIEFDKNRKRLILSSREIEQEELERKQEELWGSLEVGKIIEGKVIRLVDFGAFVDIGGLDGLIHISDLSWVRINKPSDVVNVGDLVKVEVLDLDKEKNRISLGLKQTLPKPRDIFIQNKKVGDIVTGEVVNLLDFGAFVRLEEGVEGLVHISQISTEHVKKPSDKLNIGDIVTVKIM
ncbi:MAG: bifunctional 4-hydroxy-3-methylbut-2-enyl diphosphate reductase/30S ribosomal protein S1, partial [Tissierellia bacterium]|nr:bifunctional 4-hydroxy-3-methylbut-2-enyl diphosphate reductase/30S ribosomal protein S1 [Tissierellia bacterium]